MRHAEWCWVVLGWCLVVVLGGAATLVGTVPLSLAVTVHGRHLRLLDRILNRLADRPVNPKPARA